MKHETEEQQDLIDEVVAFAHGGKEIAETLDFRDGVRYALEFMKNKSRVIKFTPNESYVASTVIGNVIDALELDNQSGLYEDGGRILFRCDGKELRALKRSYKKL